MECKDRAGATALGMALQGGWHQVAATLHQHGASTAAMATDLPADIPCDARFAAAVAAADDITVCDLVVAGEVTDCVPEELNGWRPLHVAARSGRQDAVGALLTVGVSLEAVDHQGRTALMLAAEAGTCRAVESAVLSLTALLEARCSTTARDHRGG